MAFQHLCTEKGIVITRVQGRFANQDALALIKWANESDNQSKGCRRHFVDLTEAEVDLNFEGLSFSAFTRSYGIKAESVRSAIFVNDSLKLGICNTYIKLLISNRIKAHVTKNIEKAATFLNTSVEFIKRHRIQTAMIGFSTSASFESTH